MIRLAPWLVLILALGLRLYHLGAESIYVDEMFSLNLSALSPAGIVKATAADVHPPFYYFLLAAWTNIAGRGEFPARLLSALTGTAAVALLFHLGHRILGRPAGLLAALLAALSPFLIHWSQEARGYMLMGLLSLSSMALFLHWLDKQRTRSAAAYVAVTALLIYTHTFGFFVVAAQNVWFSRLRLGEREGARPAPLRGWLVQQALLALLFIPWIAVLLSQVARMRQDFYVPRPVPARIAATFLEYAGNPASLFLFLGLAAAGLRRAARLRPLLLSWLTLPVALPYLISFFVVPVYITKATLPAAFAFYLLAAAGWAGLVRPWIRRGSMAALCLFSLWGLYGYFGHTHHDPWRQAAADLSGDVRPGDRVIVHPFFSVESFQYYFHRPGVFTAAFPSGKWKVEPGDLKSLDSMALGAPRIFYFEGHGGDPNGRVLQRLKENFSAPDPREYRVSKYFWPVTYPAITRHDFTPRPIAPPP